MKDVKALSDKAVAPDIKSVSPVVNGSSVTATRGVATETPGQVIGTTASYAEARKETVTEGTFITAADETDHARVAVIGTTVVENLFGTTTDPLGQTIQLNGVVVPGRGRAQVEGLERDPGPGRHRDRPADDRAGSARRPQRRSSARSCSRRSRRRRSTTPMPRRPRSSRRTTRTRDGTAAFSILSQSSLLQTTQRDATTRSPSCSPRSPRSRCSSAASA